MNTEENTTAGRCITGILWFFSIIIFINAFNFQHNPPGGWQQQQMPNLNNRPLADITFIDSLTGYAVTGDNSPADTNFIVKTTNGGDNWSIKGSVYRDLSRVVFLNAETGYICGGYNVSGGFLSKTTNSGLNWNQIETPSTLRIDDISVLSEDTIWIVDGNAFFGGLFRTTNGGQNWEVQYGGGLGGTKPNRVYFYDGKFGWAGENNFFSQFLLKTTNSGLNWTQVPRQNGFKKICFIDSLNGWKTRGDTMKSTSDGGSNWTNQSLQSGGNITSSFMLDFSIASGDTIWGIGGYVYSGSNARAILHYSTNGGSSWLYQIPDTSGGTFNFVNFVSTDIGWAYGIDRNGIHTATGGGPVFLDVKQISVEIPQNFHLHQNYPNPFNPTTRIRFELKSSEVVRLEVYDISGKRVSESLSSQLPAGTYEYIFNGEGLSSGVYFCTLVTSDERFTVKMVFAK